MRRWKWFRSLKVPAGRRNRRPAAPRFPHHDSPSGRARATASAATLSATRPYHRVARSVWRWSTTRSAPGVAAVTSGRRWARFRIVGGADHIRYPDAGEGRAGATTAIPSGRSTAKRCNGFKAHGCFLAGRESRPVFLVRCGAGAPEGPHGWRELIGRLRARGHRAYPVRAQHLMTRGRVVRAIVMREFGGPDVLRLEEVPEPAPRSGHALVDVTLAGVNYADLHVRGDS